MSADRLPFVGAGARLYRLRDVAVVLGVSESQVLKFQRDKLLRPIRIPGIRATRYDAAQVHALAQRWIDKAAKPSDEAVA